jgi:hypothetical protein
MYTDAPHSSHAVSTLIENKHLNLKAIEETLDADHRSAISGYTPPPAPA